MDIYMVSEWLGHSSVVITKQRYAHVTSDDLTVGARLLDQVDTYEELERAIRK